MHLLRKNKLLFVGILLTVLGFICLFIERQFYGYVDANGVLQESLLLPLGAFSVLLGCLLALLALILLLLSFFASLSKGNKHNHQD